MELSLRMKEYRDYYGWTQNDLSEKSGISISTIKKYEAGAVENFTYENLKKISSAFNVSPSDFLDEFLSVNTSDNPKNMSVNVSDKSQSLKNQNKTNDNAEENGIIAVPYFEDTYASAGDGAINYEEAPTTLNFNESFLRGFLRISGDLSKVHIINAKGDSMEPTIVNGELLFVSTANAGGVISGNVYVINYGGDVFVKRLEKNPITRAVTLFSDNEKYEPIVIDGENLKNCSIVGRVVAHIRKGLI